MTAIAAHTLAAITSAATASKEGGWSELYAVTDRSAAFNTIYATGRDAWFAGGPGIIVVKSTAGATPHKIDHRVHYIARTPLGVYAVGSRGSVWSIREDGVRMEHSLPGPRTTRDPMTLMWLTSATVDKHVGLVAFGTRLMLFGRGDGTWTPMPEPDAERRRKLLVYDRGGDVKDCGARTWLPLRGASEEGLLACDDRRTYVIGDDTRSHPRLPKTCRSPYSAARDGGNGVMVACDESKPWLLVEHDGAWA